MLYLQRAPIPELQPYIRVLWYTRAADRPVHRQRILPNGCVQVIVNLARDYILECPSPQAAVRLPASLIVGARSLYETVDTSDMADLIGILFHPGGFAPFSNSPVDSFLNTNTPLEAEWGTESRTLRERLRNTPSPHRKLALFEEFLIARFRSRLTPNPLVAFALREFARAPRVPGVAYVAERAGCSTRYLSRIFPQHVGLTPKLWSRIHRFQGAVQAVHRGAAIAWADLALDCGYYDQAHFSNEFRAFSGIDLTTYSGRLTDWPNHIPER